MQAHLAAALAAANLQRAQERAADKAAGRAEAESLRADMSVLAEAHICQVAGLVMARLRRPAGTNMGNSLIGSVPEIKRDALQNQLTQQGGRGSRGCPAAL